MFCDAKLESEDKTRNIYKKASLVNPNDFVV